MTLEAGAAEESFEDDNPIDLTTVEATLDDISTNVGNLDVTLEQIVAEMKETNIYLEKIASYFEAAEKTARDEDVINNATNDM